MSDKMGRPYNVYDEESVLLLTPLDYTVFIRVLYSFDIDFPVECDDEHWIVDESGLTFAQPPDKPSTVAAFGPGCT